MSRFPQIALLVSIGLTFAALLSAQSPSGPATPPGASIPGSSLLPATEPTVEPPATPAQQPPRHAEITYSEGSLSILANNSSLNQILREISRTTGIKISGGVADERVFGQYGPGAPAQVLTALLDGTSSNIVFVHADGTGGAPAPAELVLTPRMGGPSPPNPNAHTFDDASGPAPSLPEPVQDVPPPAQDPGAGAPTLTPADSRGPNSPNGTKTPQQIYDQLQQLRQAQQPSPQ